MATRPPPRIERAPTNFHDITNGVVSKVAEALEAYKSIPWARAATALPYVQKFREKELWLFSFVNYFISLNRVWKSIEESDYYLLPLASEQQVTFADFIDVLRKYSSKKLIRKNEKALVEFLCGCTHEFREFYMALMSRPSWLANIYGSKELKGYSDVSVINVAHIYPRATILSEGFNAISIPFAVASVSTSNLVPGVIYKVDKTLKLYRYDLRNKQRLLYKRVKVGISWLKTDQQFLYKTNFVLVGLMDVDGKKFYPMDYFDNIREYTAYKRKKVGPEQEERFKQLQEFLSSTFLRQIQKPPMSFCRDEAYLADAVGDAMTGGDSIIVLMDRYHRTEYIETTSIEGVVGSIWVENGVAKGLNVWCNSHEYHCRFSFDGVYSALLHNPKAVIGKHAEVSVFEFKEHYVGHIKEILWDKKPYRPAPYTFNTGEVGYIERCPFCLRNDIQQDHSGLCRYTVQGWKYLMGRHGVDKWFKIGKPIAKRRKELGWHPDFINNVRIQYKGYKIVSNEDGEIMFKTDTATREQYEKNIENMKLTGKLKFNTPEQHREDYLERYVRTDGKLLFGDRSEQEEHGSGSAGPEGEAGGLEVDMRGET